MAGGWEVDIWASPQLLTCDAVPPYTGGSYTLPSRSRLRHLYCTGWVVDGTPLFIVTFTLPNGMVFTPIRRLPDMTIRPADIIGTLCQHIDLGCLVVPAGTVVDFTYDLPVTGATAGDGHAALLVEALS